MNNYSILKKSPLFKGIDEQEIAEMTKCLSAETRKFRKGETIFRIGDKTDNLGVVLNGKLLLSRDDFWGNQNIINEVSEGMVFCGSYACIHGKSIDMNVIAREDTTVIFFNVERVITVCPSSCTFHTRLIHNLLSVLAQKNLNMFEKINHITQRTTREKLLSYFLTQAVRHNSNEFSISFNRQQLADYLAVERSAMSAELSKMKLDNIIDYHKNHFILKTTERIKQDN